MHIVNYLANNWLAIKKNNETVKRNLKNFKGMVYDLGCGERPYEEDILKVADLEVRTELLEYLKLNSIWSVFHYVPLHSAKAGLNFGRFDGVDQFTTKESERVIRLPMYYGINENELAKIVNAIIKFFR